MSTQTSEKVSPADKVFLTGRTPEQVNALSPEDRAEWARQCAEEQADFGEMMAFVEGLYPDVRDYVTRARAAALREFAPSLAPRGRAKKQDAPLYAAWTRLLGLVDTFQADPDFLARFRHQLAGLTGQTPQSATPPAALSEGLTFPLGRIEATDAAEVIASPAWRPGSDLDTERGPLLCVKPVQDALWAFVEVAFRRDLCDPDINGADDALNAELEKAALGHIREALGYVGVTDTATVNEIARRVINGK